MLSVVKCAQLNYEAILQCLNLSYTQFSGFDVLKRITDNPLDPDDCHFDNYNIL